MLDLINDSIPACNYRHNADINEKINRIKESICIVYDHYLSIRGKDLHNINSSYNLMEKTLAKCNVRTEFAKLIGDYTDLLNQINNKKNTDGYLIICIDDVDMVKNRHLRIMQDIHQYFMIPKVIVMITLSFPVLSSALKKEFYSNFDTIKDKEKDNFLLSFNQTNDFLRKIIPSDMRITMPSWRKSDYRELIDVKIGCSKEMLKLFDNSFERLKDGRFHNIIKKYYEKNNDVYTVSPKELIMLILSERTDIYLDVYGRKFHFMEPDSLRNLYDMFYLLYDMENITDDTENIEINKIKNRKIVLDYLHFKMLPENDFSTNVNNLIDDFLEEPIERRGIRIWGYYFKCLTSAIEKERICSVYGEKFYNEEKDKYKIENYSFGEVFRVLYSASRLGLEEMDRRLIKFVLASFSFSFPQYVEKEKNEIIGSFGKDIDKHNKHIAHLSSIFGYTLIGTWRKALFNGNDIDIILDPKELQKIFKKTELDDEKISDFINTLIKYIMLSSCSFDNYINVYSAANDASKKNDIKYYMDMKIDPTAYIMNTIGIDERMSRLRFLFEDEKIVTKVTDEGVVYSVTELIVKILSTKEIITKENESGIRRKINESVKNTISNIKSQAINDNFPWFLIQNIDLTYNVIKRSISSLIYNSNSNIKEKRTVNGTPYEIIQNFYRLLSDNLKKEDKIFFSAGYTNFSYIFKNNCIVNAFISNQLTKCKSCRVEVHKKAHVDKMLGKLFYSMQDQTGIYWADICALQLYYSEYLYNEIEPSERKDILTYISAYRNHEFGFIVLTGLIDEILKIDDKYGIDLDSMESEVINTLNDCLTRLQDQQGDMWSDIESLRYYFADELKQKLSKDQVKALIILIEKYRKKDIKFEELIHSIQSQVINGE